MPTQEQAAKAWKHMNKGKKYYDAMTDEQKKAAWQYGYDRNLIDTSKLGPGASAEYQKYVDPSHPQYKPQASIVQKNFPEVYKTQNEKLREAVIPQGIRDLVSKSPKQIVAEQRRILNERRLEEFEPTPKKPLNAGTKTQIPIGKAGIIKKDLQPKTGNMIPVGKAGLVKTQAREFNNADAALLGALDSTTLGALKIKDDPTIQKHKGAFTAGQVAGYIAPGTALTNAAGKGLAKLGAGKLMQNIGGSAIAGAVIDTSQGLVEGDTGKELAKRVGRGAVIGLAADGALMGLGAAGKAIMKKLANKQALSAAEKAMVDKLPEEAKKEIIFYVDQYGNASKTQNTLLLLGEGKTATPKTLQREAPFTIAKANKQPVSNLKPLGNNSIPPIANKSAMGRINASGEAAAREATKESELIQTHKNINNLKYQIDNATDPEQVKVLKKQLAAERKIVKEYNAARRQSLSDKIKGLIANSDNWKDKGMLGLQRETWDRNIVDLAGSKDGKAIKEEIFDKVHVNEAERTRFKNNSRNIIKDLNLSRQESEIVQQVGEGKIALTDIPQGMDAKKIENAVNTFRKWYDEALDKANEVLVRNGYAPVPKLENYFPHFTGDDPLMKALGIKLENVELPTDINGITHTFRPGKQFFGNFLKRTGDKTTYDAVAGFDRYVEGISNVIYHTDDIKTLRTFVDELRLKYSSDEVIKRVNDIRNNDLIDETEKEELISKLLQQGNTHLSNAVADLEEYTNVLAGKKDLADRAAERWFGRKIYNIANVLTNQVSKNLVSINPASWITNFIPITQSLATTSKKAVAQALDDTLRNIVKNDGFVDKSTFLTNRIGSDVLDKGITEKVGDTLTAPFKWIDNFTANVVTRAKYLEGIERGMAPDEAIKNADSWAAKIMGDRSKGAQPTLFNQRNPLTRALTSFQLEINNQVSFLMKDLPREYLKDGVNPQNVARLSSAIGQLALYGWAYNEMYEKLTGRRPALDPIGIALNFREDLQNPSIRKSEAGINLGKNVLQQLPFTGVIGGGRIPISAPFESFGKGIKGAYEVTVGERDAKTGLTQAAKDIGKGAAYIVPPFGGGQAIKTIEGLSAVNKGGVYKTNAAGEKALQYPIANTASNKVQAAIFGKSALSETRAFYDNKVKALGVDQTKAYEYAVNSGIQPKTVYEQILALRKLKPEQGHKGVTDKQKMNSISMNSKLSHQQKSLMIQLFVKTEQGKKLIEKK